jgi:serine/threonine protein kinase
VPTAEEQMQLNRAGANRVVGDAFLSKYRLGHQLGYGTFSTVNMCVALDGMQEYAVKIVAKNQQNGRFMRSFQREVEILKIVNHKYILRLEEIVETADTLYIVTDLLRGGDVLNRLEQHGRYSEHDARIVTKKVLEATAYLHTQGIIHRDLKPENILLARQESATDIKLCDFGHSALGNDDKDGFGTYSYLAPEVITNQKGTTAVDLWSVGVILYVLLSGTFPFDSSDDQRMFAEIVHGRYAFPDSHWRHVSAAAKDLIRCLMCTDPAKRHTVPQALRHPWLVGVNV